uniref:C-type lectin domain-containing protein n=2 Tax=Nothobranchius kadleci TaxID=1051664 RepID=A0A1A8C622_NOTKA
MEESNYANVTFKMYDIPTTEKRNNQEIIYDEVKTKEEMCDPPPAITGSPKKVPHVLVLVSLGVLCFILMLVIVSLSIHFAYEQRRLNITLMAQNQRLHAEMEALMRQTQDLIRDRDKLNWTMEVILEYDRFPVDQLCPQKVCQPCLDGWILFQSKCYLFTKHHYYYEWKSWISSQEFCRERNGDLVVIQSREEQEFISNHTMEYNDKNHGYWIGLSRRNTMDVMMWVDGSNLTVMFWGTEKPNSNSYCVLSNPHELPLANWMRVSCDMRNRWICESKALIGPD